jgi:hypothetical protein
LADAIDPFRFLPNNLVRLFGLIRIGLAQNNRYPGHSYGFRADQSLLIRFLSSLSGFFDGEMVLEYLLQSII